MATYLVRVRVRVRVWVRVRRWRRTWLGFVLGLGILGMVGGDHVRLGQRAVHRGGVGDLVRVSIRVGVRVRVTVRVRVPTPTLTPTLTLTLTRRATSNSPAPLYLGARPRTAWPSLRSAGTRQPSSPT